MAWAKIEMMQRQRDVFSVTTHLGTYNNMVITRAQHTTSEATGLSLQVQLTVTEVLFVPRPTPDAILRNQDRRPLAAIEEDVRRAREADLAAGEALDVLAGLNAEAFVTIQLDEVNRGRRQSPGITVDHAKALEAIGLTATSDVRLPPNAAHREALRPFGG